MAMVNLFRMLCVSIIVASALGIGGLMLIGQLSGQQKPRIPGRETSAYDFYPPAVQRAP